MARGLFEALHSSWEKVGSFFSGVFGEATREGLDWGAVTEALEGEGLEFAGIELSADFMLQERQASIAQQIASLSTDYLIPQALHIETERLLPTKYAYEVEITQYAADGTTTTRPYYVGADHRLTQDEILDIADGEVQNSPDEGAIGYELGGITASWMRIE